eukprot:14830560-Alexandrium_andersonii.AAC.1
MLDLATRPCEMWPFGNAERQSASHSELSRHTPVLRLCQLVLGMTAHRPFRMLVARVSVDGAGGTHL